MNIHVIVAAIVCINDLIHIKLITSRDEFPFLLVRPQRVLHTRLRLIVFTLIRHIANAQLFLDIRGSISYRVSTIADGEELPYVRVVRAFGCCLWKYS